MASGNLSPRQKMINMMYLVLTAMLALNVSKEILKVLTQLDQGMTATVASVTKGTESVYRSFEAQLKENARAQAPWELAKGVRTESQNAYTLIQEVKDLLISETGGIKYDENDSTFLMYKGQDNVSIPNNILIADKSVGGQGKAKELKEKLSALRDYLVKVAGDNEVLKEELAVEFNFENVKEGNTTKTWEAHTFEALPLAGIMPFLTDLQSRVRRMEARTVEHLYTSIDAKTIKFDAVRAVVMPKSNYVTQGETFEADVFLAAYNSGTNPEFGGLTPTSIENGVAKFSFPASGIGEKKMSGTMKLPGGEDVYTYDIVYTVAPPMVVISPTITSVLFGNYANPIEVSVPGAAPKDLIVSGPGISGGNGKYTCNPGNPGGNVTISVSVRTANGTRKAGSRQFAVKKFPPGEIIIRGRSSMDQALKMPAEVLASSAITASYGESSVVNLPLTLKQFKVTVGIQDFSCNGGLSGAAKEAIRSRRAGEIVAFSGGYASTPGGGSVKLSPANVAITD